MRTFFEKPLGTAITGAGLFHTSIFGLGRYGFGGITGDGGTDFTIITIALPPYKIVLLTSRATRTLAGRDDPAIQ